MINLSESNSFYVELITPEKTRFKGDIDYLRLPGWEGEMGILKNHAPLISLLKPGELLAEYGGKKYNLAIGEGFVSVRDNKVLLVVDSVYRPEEVDLKEVEKIIREERKYLNENPLNSPQYETHKSRKMLAEAMKKIAEKANG